MKLSNNSTIEQLLKTSFGNRFTQEQKSVILQAVEIGIDLAEIAKPEFNDEQMQLAYKHLFNDGVDAVKYIRQRFSEKQLNIIVRGLKQGLDVDLYAKREYSSVEMLQKCTNLERLQNMKLSSY